MFPLPLVAALAAAAAPSTVEPLRLETRLFGERRVAAADGTTRTALVAPDRLGPGDGVVVQVRYRNAGMRPLAGVVIANAVPRGLAYRGARGGPSPELSIDGHHFAPLAELRIGNRPATLSDVTHVRWRLSSPVTASGEGEFAFQAVVR